MLFFLLAIQGTMIPDLTGFTVDKICLSNTPSDCDGQKTAATDATLPAAITASASYLLLIEVKGAAGDGIDLSGITSRKVVWINNLIAPAADVIVDVGDGGGLGIDYLILNGQVKLTGEAELKYVYAVNAEFAADTEFNAKTVLLTAEGYTAASEMFTAENVGLVYATEENVGELTVKPEADGLSLNSESVEIDTDKLTLFLVGNGAWTITWEEGAATVTDFAFTIGFHKQLLDRLPPPSGEITVTATFAGADTLWETQAGKLVVKIEHAAGLTIAIPDAVTNSLLTFSDGGVAAEPFSPPPATIAATLTPAATQTPAPTAAPEPPVLGTPSPTPDLDDGKWDPTLKVDYLCYSSGDDCADVSSQAQASPPPFLGSIVIANPSNLKSKLAEVKSYLVVALFFSLPAQTGEDVIDLSAFRSAKVFDVVNVIGIQGGNGRKLLDNRAREVLGRVSQGNIRTRPRTEESRVKSIKAQTYLPISGGNKANDLIHYAILGDSISIADSLTVQSAYLTANTIQNPDKLTVGYALVNGPDVWAETSQVVKVKFGELGVIGGAVSGEEIGHIVFGETKWDFSEDAQSDAPYSLNYATFDKKNLSLIYVTSDAVHVTLKLADGVVAPAGINLTLQTNIRDTLWNRQQAGPELTVKFEGEWSSVTNQPTLIFQAPTAEQVKFDGDPPDPATVTIVKTAATNKRPAVPAPENGPAGGGGDDDGGLSGGAIAGIVIAVVAVVAIAAVAVWYFVLRPKKQGVGSTR
jgi:hypothetical protein